MIKRVILTSLLSIIVYANNVSGVVDFSKCITDSKYGKQEQEKIENLKSQYTSMITEKEQELKEISDKLNNVEYLEGVSPQVEEDLKLKHTALQNDLMKYQNQLYQILNQANYLFIQNMSNHVSLGSKKVAQDKKIDIMINKEACFFYNPKLDYTSYVVKEMDRNFDKEKISKNIEKKENATK